MTYWETICTTASLLCGIFDMTYKQFNYVSDDIQYGGDYRVSHASTVKAGNTFDGDCDDFVYTIEELLGEANIKSFKYTVRVYMTNQLHMILKVKHHREWYMVDNRYPAIRKWQDGIMGSMYTEVKRLI